jgi:putative membrane protein
VWHYDWGVMGGWGWFGPFHMIVWLLLLVLLVAAVVWLARSGVRAGTPPPSLPRRSAGLEILEERYARGEIDRDEYLQKKKDLAG